MLRIPATKTIVAFTLAGVALIAAAGACAQVWGFEEPLDPVALLEGDGGVADGQVPGCANEQIDSVNGLFVIGGQDGGVGSDDELCGDKDSPCASITTALVHAAALGKTTIFVVTGTYTESITVPPGITISGGWNALRTGTEITYAKACKVLPGTAVTIQAPPTETTTVIIGDVAGTVTLNDLQIETKADAGPSESLYAIRIAGGDASTPTLTLSLVDVVVVSHNGGDGVGGANGSGGNPGDAGGCSPPTDLDASLPPDSGASGSNADGGAFSPTGIGVGNGTDGTAGAFGYNGPPSATPTGVQCVSCAFAGLTCETTNGAVNSGSSGAIGCGGYGGGNGKGGQGGGSSIAIYAWNANVTTLRGSITSGNGGAGGKGGEGAAGGAGSLAPPGDAGTACDTQCGTSGLNLCAAIDSVTPQGTAGTKGGPGGTGGVGGAGAAGDSFGVVALHGSTLKIDPTTTVKAGTPGASAPGGATGLAKASVTQ